MASSANLIFLAIGYLLLKHAIADFTLQTRYQVSNKMTYGHPGGILHALIHAVLTLPVYFIFPSERAVILAITSLEFLIHYHIDYLKECAVSRYGWTPENTPFWWALGADQLLHNVTYLAITAYLFAGIIEN
ncbi:MAG: DUF3307 domain-containing protein [Hyphomicrobium sp.]|nr:DUF3307 domain-containing protein [Hyphomicrobium sp.]